jgi:hypothetical protein
MKGQQGHTDWMAATARTGNRDNTVSLGYLALGAFREDLVPLVYQEIQERVASIPKV